jgi:16S rRNA (cytidine1402-2'-O)-methyltransferase
VTDRKSLHSPHGTKTGALNPAPREISPQTLASKWQAPTRAPETLAPGLYITATPIGNLGDITHRALNVLAGVDFIACEDTRQTGKLLSHYSIKTPTRAYHDHSGTEARARLIKELQGGTRIALVSDAGTPLISDPGYKLVAAAQEAGIEVFAIPGASSVAAALSIAGLPTDHFFFAGFTAPKSAARRKEFERFRSVPGTLVFFESAKRIGAFLRDAHAVFGERPAAVAREITKKFEELRRGDLGALAEHYAQEGAPKGEIVVLIAPPSEGLGVDIDLDTAIRDALETQSVKDAAADVAALTGLAKRDIYARALAIKKSDE